MSGESGVDGAGMTLDRLRDLADAARGGSVTAFCDLVLATQEALRARIARLGVRGAAVDVIAQDTYVIAWRRFAQFEPGRDPVAWFSGIARNLVRKHFSREARRHDRAIAAQLEQGEEESVGFVPPVDLLRQCLAALAERARRIVHLHYFEERTSAEIGAEVGLEATAVRMALQRARAALQTCVERRLANEAGT